MAQSASSNGSAVSPGFAARARRVVSNTALYQLVEDMAVAVDKQNERLSAIHAMCTRILEKMA